MADDDIIAVLNAFPLGGDEQMLRLHPSNYVSRDLWIRAHAPVSSPKENAVRR